MKPDPIIFPGTLFFERGDDDIVLVLRVGDRSLSLDLDLIDGVVSFYSWTTRLGIDRTTDSNILKRCRVFSHSHEVRRR